MLLSSIVGKQIHSGSTTRGICKGVGISLKSFTVKYLLCSSESAANAHEPHADFCLPFSAVDSVDEFSVNVRKIRPVFPKTCARVFLQKPVFSSDGGFLGQVTDMELALIQNGNFTAAKIYTDKGATFPVRNVCAFSDAVILRKEQPYPLGQRIPAPIVQKLSDKTEPVVTKSVLRTAISKNTLIKLTLSLPPFNEVVR